MTRMDAAALWRFLEQTFPQAIEAGFTIETADDQAVRLRLVTGDAHLRPGGTVSGPTLMMLADTAMYLALLARVGPEALAVTTNLEMHFLRRPRPGVLVAEGQVVKLGRRLAVGQVWIRAEGDADPVALATVTYARTEDRPVS